MIFNTKMLTLLVYVVSYPILNTTKTVVIIHSRRTSPILNRKKQNLV